MERIMAIDYGDARTGIAVSDLLCSLVGFTTVIHSRSPQATAEEIGRLARQHQAGQLVLGLPKNMNGTEGPRAEKCRAMARLLEEATGLPVALWDERRTTVEAHAILHGTGKKMKDHRKNVDAVAASLILEGYLTFRKR